MARNRTLLLTICCACAGLMGAAGTGLWAAGSHGGEPATAARLALAGQFLAIHGAAIIACAAWSLTPVNAGRTGTFGLAACAGLAFGASLFAADIVWRVWAGDRLFAYAAPLGGFSVMAGWLSLAASGLTAAFSLKSIVNRH